MWSRALSVPPMISPTAPSPHELLGKKIGIYCFLCQQNVHPGAPGLLWPPTLVLTVLLRPIVNRNWTRTNHNKTDPNQSSRPITLLIKCSLLLVGIFWLAVLDSPSDHASLWQPEAGHRQCQAGPSPALPRLCRRQWKSCWTRGLKEKELLQLSPAWCSLLSPVSHRASEKRPDFKHPNRIIFSSLSFLPQFSAALIW